MASIFSGIKVLDLTRVIAGPLSTQILADMGASVYKVEKPGEGDDTRRMGPFMADSGLHASSNESAVFMAYNRGKQSLTADIATQEGAALVRQLAARRDVVVENYKAGGLKKYQLDYESLRAVNPKLIYCSVTGFGQDGPYSERPAYDFILQGMAGPMSTCGNADDTLGGGPMRTSIPITDIVTGLYANIAIISALYHRMQTGEGQYIDAAMLDATVALNGHLAVGYLMNGKIPTRVGNTNPIAAPSEVFACADGQVIVAAGNNGQFRSLCEVLRVPELADHPSFASNAQRLKNRETMRAMLAPLIAGISRGDLLLQCEKAGVPSGPINDMSQVFEDPQTLHRKLQISVRHSTGADVSLVRSPLLFSKTPVVHLAPPVLGQHSAQILADELLMSFDEIEALRQRKII